MDDDFDEEIREFLIESNENLALLDQQIVQLEQEPTNQELISSVFRTIHSVKGTCGFFGFHILQSVTHITESILGQLRERKRTLTPELITLILEAVDAVKVLLQRIEATGEEGLDETAGLRERLEEAAKACTPKPAPDAGPGIAANVAAEVAGAAATVVPALQLPASNVVTIHTESKPATSEITVALKSVDQPLTTAPISEPPLAAAPALVKTPPAGLTSIGEGAGEGQLTDSTIRVDVTLLNQLMNLVGELVLTRNQLLQSAGSLSSGIQQTSQRLNLITTELQESVMKTRMQQIGVVWNKLPRVVRDLSAQCGKQIHLEMHGAETELDKSLIEAIRDPLTHIVRNSCDHGIEMPQDRLAKGKPAVGMLSMRAFHEAGAVNIEIIDDGAGIDPNRVRAKAVEKKLITPEYAANLSVAECINLIFLPGFSTAQQVTSISGRGVGMDVVKTNIEKISGSVKIVCPPSGGTCLSIKIPLTLAIIPGLIVSCDNPDTAGREERFVIPQSHLVELTRVDIRAANRNIDRVNGTLIFRHRGNLLPLVFLPELLNGKEAAVDVDTINIIILQVQNKQFGLVVDRICDTQEIVVKPLGRQLKQLTCYGGATIMGDGRPALILDVNGIAKLAGLDAQTRDTLQEGTAVKQNSALTEFLLFQVGKDYRMALPISIVNRLEEVPANSVEYAAGQAVMRYRGKLLPLLSMASVVGETQARPIEDSTMNVIVINNGSNPFGLIVDRILDIVEESLSTVRGSTNPSLLGSAVIGGKVTDIVDGTALSSSLSGSWNRSAEESRYTRCIAFYNPWHLGAEMMHTLLDAAGYAHFRLQSADQANDLVKRGEVDLLLVDRNDESSLPGWLENVRCEGGVLAGIPTIELMDSASHVDGSGRGISNMFVCMNRKDHAEILRTMELMISAPKEKAA